MQSHPRYSSLRFLAFFSWCQSAWDRRYRSRILRWFCTPSDLAKLSQCFHFTTSGKLASHTLGFCTAEVHPRVPACKKDLECHWQPLCISTLLRSIILLKQVPFPSPAHRWLPWVLFLVWVPALQESCIIRSTFQARSTPERTTLFHWEQRCEGVICFVLWWHLSQWLSLYQKHWRTNYPFSSTPYPDMYLYPLAAPIGWGSSFLEDHFLKNSSPSSLVRMEPSPLAAPGIPHLTII